MKLGIQLYPHNNKRYYDSMKQLAISELSIILDNIISPEALTFESIGGLELLTFRLETSTKEIINRIYKHSALLALYEIDRQLLKPLMTEYGHYFNQDLAHILKYKGKTNEMFTDMMLNIGVFASDFDHTHALNVLDVMCGKATSMFMALKHGYHSAGIELNQKYYSEVENFIKRYFQFNKVKHNLSRTSYDIPDQKRALKFTLETADTPEHYKSSDTRTLQYVLGDTRFAPRYFGKKKFHTIIADLPYGVQHQSPPKKSKQSGKKKPQENLSPDKSILKTIDESLNGWLSTLKPGGTIVLAYNSNSIDTKILKSLMTERALTVMDSGIYGNFSHWVKQSITRDIMIIKK